MKTVKKVNKPALLTGSPPDLSSLVLAKEDLSAASPSRDEYTTRYDLRVLHSLRQIIRAVDLHSRHLHSKHKITGPQLISLLTIEKHEPVTASTIANQIHLSPSTVIGILDRLEAKGFIHRDRDRRDRRLVQISLTDQGKLLARNAPSPLQDTLARAMEKLPEDELSTIAGSLERIVELMNLQHIDAAPILETGPINAKATDPLKHLKPGE